MAALQQFAALPRPRDLHGSRPATLVRTSRLLQTADPPRADRLRYVCALEHPLRLLFTSRIQPRKPGFRRPRTRATLREPHPARCVLMPKRPAVLTRRKENRGLGRVEQDRQIMSQKSLPNFP